VRRHVFDVRDRAPEDRTDGEAVSFRYALLPITQLRPKKIVKRVGELGAHSPTVELWEVDPAPAVGHGDVGDLLDRIFQEVGRGFKLPEIVGVALGRA
jgi:hypothetical protein